jgi:elongation factor Ts
LEDEKMAITAAMVKELREMTGAGMMDCKKALNETNGNMDEAVEFLRKNGQAKAEKKASRIAAEGLCSVVAKDDKTAAVVEVNSETDFVAKNETFQQFVKAVANQAVNSDAADMDAFLSEKWNEDESQTVNEALVAKVAVIGENLKIRRFEKVVASNGCVASYVHGGGRIGVIVEAETDTVNDDVKEAMVNIAMQVAALNPKYVSREEISAEYIAHEKEILLAQIMNDPKESQKPEKVINGMIEGRVSKELKEICLVDQVYVKAEDGKQTVAKYLEEVSKKVGTTVKVKRFVRFETGEGIEKKQEDFAAEVAAQMNA